MPELTPQSTPPHFTVLPPPPPPPRLSNWEDAPAFRFTFLYHFTEEGNRDTLERLGAMLYDMALEASKVWPGWTESATRTELRAVAADLRHAALFLATVGNEHRTVSLQSQDDRLSHMAETWAETARQLAAAIEDALGPIQAERRG